jgi:C-terminal processing protease CtpA/Prc
MRKLEAYWRFVREVALPLESSLPECSSGACTANRKLLEQAWQVVSNEFFDGGGGGGQQTSGKRQQQQQQQRFSQAWWAGQLLPALTLDGPDLAAATAADATTSASSPRPPRGVLTTRADAEAALRWMVASLGDRYSTYLPPAAWASALRRPVPANARRYLEAQSVGVGLALGAVTPVPGFAPALTGRVVESPMAGSPAEEAGVLRGDVVLALDGLPAADLPASAAARILRGPSGSSITVTLAPRSPYEGNAAPRDLVLERRPIPQPAVREARLPLPPPPDGAFSSSSFSSFASTTTRPPPREALYLRVNYFSHATTKALAAALSAAAADPAVAGIVLDLRNDPGGVFEEAIADAAMLVGDADAPVAATVRSPYGGVDAVWRGSALPGEIFTPAAQRAARLVGTWAPAGGAVPPLSERPVAVLLNRSSASASELLAVAGRDTARAAAAARQRFGFAEAAPSAASFPSVAASDDDKASSSSPSTHTTAVVVPRVALIGERTFGKGLVQFHFPLGGGAGGGGDSSLSAGSSFPPSSPLVASGGGLKLTVAKYVGPHGTDVARDGGVLPDMRCADHPRGVGRGVADACILRAINFLSGSA